MKRALKALLYTLGIVVLFMSMTYLGHNYPITMFIISIIGLFSVMYWVLGD